MRKARWLVGSALAVVVVACGGNGDDAATDEGLDPGVQDESIDEDPATSDDAQDLEDAAGTTLTVTATDVGDILVDGNGLALYLFDQDSDGVSVCYDDCAANWPPLLAPVEAGAGIDDALLGTGERTDGTDQVTYGGYPLYYFAGDGGPGERNGQGVGDVWWVVSPEGERITDPSADTAGRDY